MTQSKQRIGIAHTGWMGSSLARVLVAKGHEVYFASDDRSGKTIAAGLESGAVDVGSLDNLFGKCDVIISICQGAGVFAIAENAVMSSFGGLFVDANHIGSREMEDKLSNLLAESGVQYVEAAIYGWPYPHESDPHGERVFYFTGDRSGEMVEIFSGTPFHPVVPDVPAKELKRQREEANKNDVPPLVDHGFGVVEFPEIIAIDDVFVDEYIQRRMAVEPRDYEEMPDGRLINRGGYIFTADQVSGAPIRYLNLTPSGSPQEDLDFHSKLQDALMKCIHAYLKVYPEARDCVQWRSDAHLAVYGPGAGMGLHHDCAIGSSAENENSAFNVISASLIISDRCDGGELGLKFINKSFKPVKGTAVLYPSGFTGAHYVEPVTRGQRISYLEFFGHGTKLGQTIRI